MNDWFKDWYRSRSLIIGIEEEELEIEREIDRTEVCKTSKKIPLQSGKVRRSTNERSTRSFGVVSKRKNIFHRIQSNRKNRNRY